MCAGKVPLKVQASSVGPEQTCRQGLARVWAGKGSMLGAGSGARRWAADFALAFMLFWAMALTFGASHSHAHAPSWPVLVPAGRTPDAAPPRPAGFRAPGPTTRP